MSKTKSGKTIKGGFNGENSDLWMPIVLILIVAGLGTAIAFAIPHGGSGGVKLQ